MNERRVHPNPFYVLANTGTLEELGLSYLVHQHLKCTEPIAFMDFGPDEHTLVLFVWLVDWQVRSLCET